MVRAHNRHNAPKGKGKAKAMEGRKKKGTMENGGVGTAHEQMPTTMQFPRIQDHDVWREIGNGSIIAKKQEMKTGTRLQC